MNSSVKKPPNVEYFFPKRRNQIHRKQKKRILFRHASTTDNQCAGHTDSQTAVYYFVVVVVIVCLRRSLNKSRLAACCSTTKIHPNKLSIKQAFVCLFVDVYGRELSNHATILWESTQAGLLNVAHLIPNKTNTNKFLFHRK